MEPRVTRREKKLHLSYDLPHRIHCSHVYPIIAPNGSTVILYAHSRGLRILWRGGRRRKEAEGGGPGASRVNGTNRRNVINIDDEDHDDARGSATDNAGLDALYEASEAEEDPDCPYPEIINDVDVDLDIDLLSLAVPGISSLPSSLPKRLTDRALVAAADADGRIMFFRIPLAMPTSEELHIYVAEIKRSMINLGQDSRGVPKLSVKILATTDDNSTTKRENHVLIASVTNYLTVWKLDVSDESTARNKASLINSVLLPSLGCHVAFHPSPRSQWLMLSDIFGTVRIYDPLANSVDSNSAGHASSGEWIMSYLVPYQTLEEPTTSTQRKKILDTNWILGGRGILVLLDDGEWGIWSLSGQVDSSRTVQQFSLGGYLDPLNPSDVADMAKPRKGSSKLAPMTPNTRKSKADALFSGPLKTQRVSTGGGIIVTTSVTRLNATNESAVLWYGGDVYTIPNVQVFWQRSTNSGGALGSLYNPGLTHLPAINMMNEDITSVSQIYDNIGSSALGHAANTPDLLISAEHRLIIIRSLQSASKSRNLFEQPLGEPSLSRDQQMLDAGELDLGGMDRMLENLSGEGRVRKVGFAPN